MSRPRARAAAGLAGGAILLATLAGCGESEYCKAVEENQVALNSLGEKRTNAAYLSYARAFRTVAKVAPPTIRKDWIKLADVTSNVVTAQRKAGISLEDMLVEDKITKVPPDKLELLNDAYEAFNNTQDERKAVVKNVKDECEITLS
ncbi:MAG TPA: hypothetical protein VJ782_05530 [Aeromicrobium sp.]|nr:hypothetical protein [Aeromicrobium sp.]